nr:MAG TPA: hypothetical protein [Caudoviricetes sp.]
MAKGGGPTRTVGANSTRKGDALNSQGFVLNKSVGKMTIEDIRKAYSDIRELVKLHGNPVAEAQNNLNKVRAEEIKKEEAKLINEDIVGAAKYGTTVGRLSVSVVAAENISKNPTSKIVEAEKELNRVRKIEEEYTESVGRMINKLNSRYNKLTRK